MLDVHTFLSAVRKLAEQLNLCDRSMVQFPLVSRGRHASNHWLWIWVSLTHTFLQLRLTTRMITRGTPVDIHNLSGITNFTFVNNSFMSVSPTLVPDMVDSPSICGSICVALNHSTNLLSTFPRSSCALDSAWHEEGDQMRENPWARSAVPTREGSFVIVPSALVSEWNRHAVAAEDVLTPRHPLAVPTAFSQARGRLQRCLAFSRAYVPPRPLAASHNTMKLQASQYAKTPGTRRDRKRQTTTREKANKH